MVEHGVNRKLSEADSYRPDSDKLSREDARKSAERLAAALTLAKSFTLRAVGHGSDPTLAPGALDPGAVLEELTDAKRAALLRRGLFAPATYGRVRFHHRATQEYLTARWLDRLLHGSGSRQEIWNLVFASRYGVQAIVPSLRPAVAWLALWHADFRDEIISREPLVLIRYGDPGSLTIETRIRLLGAYATKHAESDISDDSLDNRAVWMFSDERLAQALRDAWTANADSYFRFDLLRFIREGAVAACVDLARGVALDRKADKYHRVVAMQALIACKDQGGLSAAARDLVDDAENLSPRLSVECAKVLYPSHLTLAQLFTLIERVRPPKEYSGEGFGYAIEDLFQATLSVDERREFIGRLGDLCLSEPFVESYQRVSKRYAELARHLEPIARSEVLARGDGKPSGYLVRLLMTVERAEAGYDRSPDGPRLPELIHGRPEIQRALFWADVVEQRVHDKGDNDVVGFWAVLPGHSLWQLGETDLPWLFKDLDARTDERDQRIALSAILAILNTARKLDTELARLRALIEGRQYLKADMVSFLAPARPTDARLEQYQVRAAKFREEQAEKERKNKESWRRFEQDLRMNPGQIRDPRNLESWRAGAWRLWDLTRWLMSRASVGEEAASKHWRLLEEGFGREVAEAYRDGLRIHWRNTRPERPRRGQGSAITVKHANIIAFGAIGVEADEDSDWASALTDHEARRAGLHGCLTEQGYPTWIEDLIASHPRVVLPIIRQAIRAEYLFDGPAPSSFVYRYSRGAEAVHPAIQGLLFRLIASKEPRHASKFDCMLGMIERIQLAPGQRRKLLRISEQRLDAHRAGGRLNEARWFLAMQLLLDFDRGLAHLERWLTSVPSPMAKEHAEQTFAFLFDRHNSIIPSALPNASVADLERLLRLVYAHIRPDADAHHEGSYSPDTRDHAEHARSFILGAILDRPGADAYYSLRRVASDPAVALRAARFCELARGKAERDAELLAWAPKEVLTFERERTAPVKIGADLLRLVEAVMKDIQFQLAKGDASSRDLLQHAKDEDEVQGWLVEQLNLRSSGRYRAFREAQVALGDKPDVIIASTSASCEVAVEVKLGEKWTLRQLDHALRNQLAEDYLKPETRRHGLLVVTHHVARRWRDTETNELLTFGSLIQRLASTAATIRCNSAGAIEVRCVGIDASTRLRT
jgi:hypothetical protein